MSRNKYIEKAIAFSIVLITLNCFLSNLGMYNYRTSPSLLCGSVLLFAITVMEYHTRRRKFNRPFWFSLVCEMLMGVSYLVSGATFFVPTYFMLGFIFLFQLPLFYMLVSEERLKVILNITAKAFIAASVVCMVLSLLLFPPVESQYPGIFNNPNLFGECISSTMVFVIYAYEKSTGRKHKILLSVLCGALLSFAILTKSRTTLLSLILTAAVYLFYILKTDKDLKKILSVGLLSTVLVFPATYGVLYYVTPAVSQFIQTEITGEFINGKDHGGSVSGWPNGEGLNAKPGASLSKELKSTVKRFLKGIFNEDSFLSGRAEIWKIYFKNLSMRGHGPKRLPVPYKRKILYANAHNAFLQIGYQAGITAGVAYLLEILFCSACLVKKLKKDGITTRAMALMAAMANMLVGLVLSSAFAPYNTFSAMIYWIAVIPECYSKEKEEQQQDRKL